MRIESSVTAVSWVPLDCVEGGQRLHFHVGAAQYDDPPPGHLDDLPGLLTAGRVRLANQLQAFIEVDHGRIVGHGQSGRGDVGAPGHPARSTSSPGSGSGPGGPRGAAPPASVGFTAVPLPDLHPDPVVGDGWVRFGQTAGGLLSLGMPYSTATTDPTRLAAPAAWTTLALTIHADGASEGALVGASPFPRHWVYDAAGKLAQKAGLTDFKEWYRHAFGKHTPWGDEDSKVLVTTVETALERELSRVVMRGGGEPKIRKLRKGKALTKQGEPGDEVFLLLDGILSVNVDNEPLAELGPGAILGERAVLEGGVRTSTLRAVTKCKVAAVPADHLDPEALTEISKSHRREET